MTKQAQFVAGIIDACPTDEERQFLLRIVNAYANGGEEIRAKLFEASKHKEPRQAIEAILESMAA